MDPMVQPLRGSFTVWQLAEWKSNENTSQIDFSLMKMQHEKLSGASWQLQSFSFGEAFFEECALLAETT